MHLMRKDNGWFVVVKIASKQALLLPRIVNAEGVYIILSPE